jgi:hypothetical protein
MWALFATATPGAPRNAPHVFETLTSHSSHDDVHRLPPQSCIRSHCYSLTEALETTVAHTDQVTHLALLRRMFRHVGCPP